MFGFDRQPAIAQARSDGTTRDPMPWARWSVLPGAPASLGMHHKRQPGLPWLSFRPAKYLRSRGNLARRPSAHGAGGRAEGIFAEDFAGRILPFEAMVAARYADIVLARRRAGNPIEGFDALIAATALAKAASVTTRDTRGFAGCGVTLMDPRTRT